MMRSYIVAVVVVVGENNFVFGKEESLLHCVTFVTLQHIRLDLRQTSCAAVGYSEKYHFSLRNRVITLLIQ